MIDTNKPPLEAIYLVHFGVKGMKWGRRKSEPSNLTPAQARSQAIREVESKQRKLNGTRIFDAQLRAGNANRSRAGRRRIAKEEKALGRKLTWNEAYKLGAARDKRRIAGKTAVQAVLAGSAMAYGIRKLPASRQVKIGAAAYGGGLIANLAIRRTTQIRDHKQATRAQELAKERRSIIDN